MLDILGKYQASLFLNADDIIPTPQLITKLTNLFQDKGFLPSTIQEISSQNPVPQLRLRLSSMNGEWKVSFSQNRVLVEKCPIEMHGKNLGSIDNFVVEAIEIIRRVQGELNKKGNRFALVSSAMLREMSGAELDAVYKKLLKPFPGFSESMPFEWSARVAVHTDVDILGKQEKLNVISNISRVSGHYINPDSVMEFDRIEIELDINTVPDNLELRFGVESLEDFFTGAIEVRAKVLQGINEVICE